jgi:hypothetical protein
MIFYQDCKRPVAFLYASRSGDALDARRALFVVMYQERIVKSENCIRLVRRTLHSRSKPQSLKTAREVIRESSDARSPRKNRRGRNRIRNNLVFVKTLVKNLERFALHCTNMARDVVLYPQARASRFNCLKRVKARDKKPRGWPTRSATIQNTQTSPRMQRQQSPQESIHR